MNNNRVSHIDSSGREVYTDDEWWEGVLDNYEQAGYDTDLVNMARPLFEGDVREREMGEKFLARVHRDYVDTVPAMAQLRDLMGDLRITPGKINFASDDAMNRAWDEMSGGSQRSGPGANYSVTPTYNEGD